MYYVFGLLMGVYVVVHIAVFAVSVLATACSSLFFWLPLYFVRLAVDSSFEFSTFNNQIIYSYIFMR
jgi:hypothetical protein